MLKIRLARAGAKRYPFYHIVVADSRRARDGRYVQRLGFFAPKASGAAPRLQIDLEQMQNWRERGAQPTERVLRLVREHNWGEEKVASLRAKSQEQKRARAQRKAAEAAAAAE